MFNSILPPKSLIIASRKSRLAMWQAEFVRAQLQTHYPNCTIDILGMTTQGDRVLDHSLAKIGGKGLFIKELELALLEGKADLAVHSLKDVPMELPHDFCLAAMLKREEPLDAFVSNTYSSLSALPSNAVIGTSSLRREMIVRYRFPHLRIQPLRGNLETRLQKLDRAEYDAIILAAAGLKRLGMTERIRALLETEESLPAVGQGALTIEVLSHRQDLLAWLKRLQHTPTLLAVSAERALAQALGGSCHHPLAAYADWLNDGRLRLRAMLGLPDGRVCIQDAMQASVNDVSAACQLGRELAQCLVRQGADQILKIIADQSKS